LELLKLFSRLDTGVNTMKSRDTQVIAGCIVLMALSLLAGCTSQTVTMIQPRTGATAECSGSSYGFGPLFSETISDSCARVYEDRGFVPLERLTPEDRASLEQRGLLPK
jgi:hypothetical protein